MSKMRYAVQLPTYETGDDFDSLLSIHDDSVVALRNLSTMFRESADRCDDLADYFDENSIPAQVSGMGHFIFVDSHVSLDTLTTPTGPDTVPLLTIVEVEDTCEDYGCEYCGD